MNWHRVGAFHVLRVFSGSWSQPDVSSNGRLNVFVEPLKLVKLSGKLIVMPEFVAHFAQCISTIFKSLFMFPVLKSPEKLLMVKSIVPPYTTPCHPRNLAGALKYHKSSSFPEFMLRVSSVA